MHTISHQWKIFIIQRKIGTFKFYHAILVKMKIFFKKKKSVHNQICSIAETKIIKGQLEVITHLIGNHNSSSPEGEKKSRKHIRERHDRTIQKNMNNSFGLPLLIRLVWFFHGFCIDWGEDEGYGGSLMQWGVWVTWNSVTSYHFRRNYFSHLMIFSRTI